MKPQRILIAEDDELVAAVLIHKLSDQGYDVAWASDGRSAMQMFIDLPPDLIVLDMMMPIMDGRQVIRSIRSLGEGCNVPIVVLTARRQEEDIVEALSQGATDYLVKPFSAKELLARVDRILSAGVAGRPKIDGAAISDRPASSAAA